MPHLLSPSASRELPKRGLRVAGACDVGCRCPRLSTRAGSARGARRQAAAGQLAPQDAPALHLGRRARAPPARSSTRSRTSSAPTSCAGRPTSSSRRRTAPASCPGTRTRPTGAWTRTTSSRPGWRSPSQPRERLHAGHARLAHRIDQLPHVDTFHKDNLLSRGQEIAVEVDESEGRRHRAARRRDVAASHQARARLGRPTAPTTGASGWRSATSRPTCGS